MSADRNYPPFSRDLYEQIVKEIDAMLEQIKICPCCGQPMNTRNDAKKYFEKEKEKNE